MDNPTPRTRVRRLPNRAHYDADTLHAILDEALVCHVAFADGDHPYAIPTGFARLGDRIVLHGSAASRMMRLLASGAPVCITVTLLDGLVLARSAFHHSMNYRSVVILGRAAAIDDPQRKSEVLHAFMEKILPGRWEQVRPPNPAELAATTVVEIPVAEASAKIRTGGPVDDAEDMAQPCWAGVVPITTVRGEPVAG